MHPLCNNQLFAHNDEQYRGSEKTDTSSEKTGFGSEESSEKNGLGSEKTDTSSEKPYDIIQAILEAIRKNAKVSAAEIAMQVGVSARAVEKRIRTLRENGVIKRVGPDKGGSWEIIDDKM